MAWLRQSACVADLSPGFAGASAYFGPQNLTFSRGLKVYSQDIHAQLLPRTSSGGVSGIMLAAGNSALSKVAGYIC